MRNSKRVVFLLLIATISVTAVLAFQTAQQGESNNDKPNDKPKKYTRQNFDMGDFESQFPIADFSEQEPTDAKEQAKRRARSGRYDNRAFVGRPENSWKGTGAYWINHWDRDLDELPADQSELVVVGKVLDARAYLSNDKSGVYSEFALRVERVLKGETPEAAPGKVVEAEREGGRVRFSADDIDTYEVAGIGMPRPGRRYVFFLKSVEAQPDYYSILRAFEIHGKRIYPLDKRATSSSPLDAFWEMEEAAFEQIVKDKIT
jgi:hypothetical protein